MANTTFNPADISNGTLSNGNLTITGGASNGGVRTIDRQVTGSFYWEYTFPANNSSLGVGIANSRTILSSAYSSLLDICYLWTNGQVYFDPAATTITLGSLTGGGTVGIAWRGDLNQIWFRICPAGNWNGNASFDPTTGVGGLALAGAGHAFGGAFPIYPAVVYNGSGTGRVITANFGDTTFSGVVPAGFTSGFTAGATIGTSAIATQTIAEHWLAANPNAQITQVALEHWMSVSSTNLQAIVTQVMLEHWTSVASVGDVTPASPQARVLVLA